MPTISIRTHLGFLDVSVLLNDEELKRVRVKTCYCEAGNQILGSVGWSIKTDFRITQLPAPLLDDQRVRLAKLVEHILNVNGTPKFQNP